MAEYVDRFDSKESRATQPKPAAPVDNTGLRDRFDDPQAVIRSAAKGENPGYATGTFETVHGQDPSRIKTQPAPSMPITRQIAAGTIADPAERNKYYARQRFPNDPKAAERYGYIGGDPVYVGDDGNVYREDEGVATWAGGNALPIIGGTVGGIMGATVGAGPMGAALGAEAGTAYTKLAANALGEDQTAGGNLWDIAVEGFLNGLGWGVGEAIGRGTAERKVAKDIGKFSKTKTVQLQQLAREKFGIDLTPAEASNLGSLIHEQTRLGMGMDEAGDLVKSFLQRRAQTIL